MSENEHAEWLKNARYCPLAAATPDLGNFCLKDECALWNEHLGCCGLIATGVIQGAAIVRKEMRDDRDGEREREARINELEMCPF
ncbi:MAG: hypothetical protein ABID84_03610 [Chloroflexota bacterium]